MDNFFWLTFMLLNLTLKINAEGILWEPTSRMSAWRVNSTQFPIYYSDKVICCGGFTVQWNQNDGKCSICGEDYSLKNKLFEKGGEFYRGFIVRTYEEEDEHINVDIQLTANRLGWFEFRLCNVDSMEEATQECLDKLLLANENGQTRFEEASQGTVGHFKYNLTIPSEFECEHCVFQWKYNTGNSWGTDKQSGKSCKGCGPQQQFIACSDIRIKKRKIQLETSSITSTISENFKNLTKENLSQNKVNKANENLSIYFLLLIVFFHIYF